MNETKKFPGFHKKSGSSANNDKSVIISIKLNGNTHVVITGGTNENGGI